MSLKNYRVTLKIEKEYTGSNEQEVRNIFIDSIMEDKFWDELIEYNTTVKRLTWTEVE